MEREQAVTFKGNPMTLVGPALQAGDKAPEFRVVANDLSHVSSAELLGGKAVLLSAVPSLDTGICDAETRRFNEEAGKRGDKVSIVTISHDLPFAQSRWCGAAGIENVITYSDYYFREFGPAYGCFVKELGILSRAVFVVDVEGVVRYVEYVPEIAQHPDYEKALAALDALL